jgi:hypothetical protein
MHGFMPRRPSKLLPPTPEKADLKGDPKESTDRPETDPSAEKPRVLKPGMKGPDGRRIPPPPHAKGTRFLGPRPRKRKVEEIPESIAAFAKEIRLRTRHECERGAALIVNWIKSDLVDANKGNSMLNGVRTILQSKTDTEQMQIKTADRMLFDHLREMEEDQALLRAKLDEKKAKEEEAKQQIH